MMEFSKQNLINIYILSYGINPFRDTTLETLNILKKSKEIYVIFAHQRMRDFFKKYNICYQDITYFYKEKMKRKDIYNNIANFVISKAEKNKTICYLSYGNVMILDRPVSLIINKAHKKNLSVKAIPSISFVDVILSELNISIGPEGVTIYEANYLVTNKIKIDSQSHCIITQIGSFNSDCVSREKALTIEPLTILVNYLRQFYPPEHIVTICDSDEIEQNISSCKTPLCLLTLFREGINYRSTLYISPVRRCLKSVNGY